ncbi:ATP-binding protein [Brooklawnia cerclae]|uniref:Signal transduction histidine kinase/phage shock protein PspC (Stress-responsive transcriptional regulator) n=1 Tax=Brooklawnia cerclae TaxID=349934 RepID=A0ABX0SDE6_9ACTN|nr:ATP-binding protein [Brooklawnia cerclae]NIH55904.1 signal transduction histidine kinase/phage shock protein PspC (stress-responsive transcriptional regulator) [Brooklawnia cerclae]
MPPQPRPPLYRDRDEAWLGGVASGMARHLGWPIWLVRLCFVALTLTSYLSIVIYGALWLLMAAEPTQEEPPGLRAASHDDMRPSQPKQERPASNAGRVTAVVMVGFGVIMLAQTMGLGVTNAFFWPALLAGIGVALFWLQADESDDAEGAAAKNVPEWLAPFIGSHRLAAMLRIVLGMGLLGTGMSMVAASRIGVEQLPIVAWVVALTVAGSVVVAAPWMLRYRRKLDRAREEKLIADTRADMAAHLHDSVLQTLALIQRQADDPKQVASLARRQERELRTWLYADVTGPVTLKAALVQAGGEVEDERGVPVEVVCVGDIDLTDDLRAMVKAAREAMMNAAKHSQADAIDVYAEVEEADGDKHVVQVFVRDRGRGFDLDAIADDRMGVRGSIIGRMERHGGTARVRSAPGEGTEIRLEMKA